MNSRQAWSALIISLSVFLLLPIFTIVASIFQIDATIWSHLYQTVLTEYVLNSLILMLGVSVSTFLIGVLPAWLVTMYEFPFRRFFEWALLLPLAMPAYIIAYAYTGVLDVSGPVQLFIRETFSLNYGEYWFPDVRSMPGAIAMLSFVLFPYVYLLSRAAFLQQSISMLEVARSLGCSAKQTFFKVALPLARPAIVVGIMLVLMETLADYGTVQYFGLSVFTTGIFRTWFGLGDSAAAAQLSCLVLIFVGLFIYLEKLSRKQSAFHNSGNRNVFSQRVTLKGRNLLFALIVCFYPLLFGFIIPATVLLVWTFEVYADTLTADYFELVLNSFLLAVIASLCVLVIACLMAYGRRYINTKLVRFFTQLTTLGYAIPGVVIAVGVLIPLAWFDHQLNDLFKQHFGIETGLLLSGGIFILIFAYAVRYIAVSHNAIDAGLAKVKPAMDETAQTLGYGLVQILGKIHLPIIKASVFTAMLLVFVEVLKELPATLILRPFNFNTLAVKTYELANEELLAEAALPALAIVIVGVLPVILLSQTISANQKT